VDDCPRFGPFDLSSFPTALGMFTFFQFPLFVSHKLRFDPSGCQLYFATAFRVFSPLFASLSDWTVGCAPFCPFRNWRGPLVRFRGLWAVCPSHRLTRLLPFYNAPLSFVYWCLLLFFPGVVFSHLRWIFTTLSWTECLLFFSVSPFSSLSLVRPCYMNSPLRTRHDLPLVRAARWESPPR